MAARTMNSILPQVTGIQQPTAGHWGTQLPRRGAHLSPQDSEFWGGISTLIQRSCPSLSAEGDETGSSSSHLWPEARGGHSQRAKPAAKDSEKTQRTCHPGAAEPALGLPCPLSSEESLNRPRPSEAGSQDPARTHWDWGRGLGDRACSPKRQVVLRRNGATP